MAESKIKRKPKYYYVYTTKDIYRLPLAVADTAEDLANMVGVDTKTVYKEIERGNKGLYEPRYYRVLREDT